MAGRWRDRIRDFMQPPVPVGPFPTWGHRASAVLNGARRLSPFVRPLAYAALAVAIAGVFLEFLELDVVLAIGFHVGVVTGILGFWLRGVERRPGWAGRVSKAVLAGTLLVPVGILLNAWWDGTLPNAFTLLGGELLVASLTSFLLGGLPALLVALWAEKRIVREGYVSWVLRGAASGFAGLSLSLIAAEWYFGLSFSISVLDWLDPWSLGWYACVHAPFYSATFFSIPVVVGVALGMDRGRRLRNEGGPSGPAPGVGSAYDGPGTGPASSLRSDAGTVPNRSGPLPSAGLAEGAHEIEVV
jgi:hypothetical protein